MAGVPTTPHLRPCSDHERLATALGIPSGPWGGVSANRVRGRMVFGLLWKVGPSLGRSQHLSWKVHWAILVAVGELVGDTRWELFSPRAPGRGTRAAERPPPRSGFRVLAEFGQLVTQPSVVPDPRGDQGLDSTQLPRGTGGTTGDDQVEGALILSSPAPFLQPHTSGGCRQHPSQSSRCCRDSASAVQKAACRHVHVPDPGTHGRVPSPPAPGPFHSHTGGHEGSLRGLCAKQPHCEKIGTQVPSQSVL